MPSGRSCREPDRRATGQAGRAHGGSQPARTDGNYLLARSYMGQGLIVQGKIEEARAQLIEIRDRGGKDTYAYHALYDALKRKLTY